jgi:hypothetical protein
VTANRGDQIERRETGVGDDHDLAIWHRFNAAVSFRQMMGEAPLQANPLPEKNPGEAFGPFKPFSQARDAGLDAGQRRFVADLIERYTTRTPGSKDMTQASRAVLADPRVAAGFHPEWNRNGRGSFTRSSPSAPRARNFGTSMTTFIIDLLNGFGPTPSASVISLLVVAAAMLVHPCAKSWKFGSQHRPALGAQGAIQRFDDRASLSDDRRPARDPAHEVHR